MDKTTYFPGESGCVRVLSFVRFCMFGFLYTRNKTSRSVCSVDFVEKLWESLRISLRKTCEKVSTVFEKNEFYTFLGRILHTIMKSGESFAGGFAHRFLSVMWGFCTVSTGSITTTTNILGRE